MGEQKQPRRMSLVEAVTNVLLGFGVALLTQIIVFPLFSLEVSLGENLAIGGLFTLASIARSYALPQGLRSDPGTAIDEDGRRDPIMPGSALVLNSWLRYL